VPQSAVIKIREARHAPSTRRLAFYQLQLMQHQLARRARDRCVCR
jgi:hypothetical protein